MLVVNYLMNGKGGKPEDLNDLSISTRDVSFASIIYKVSKI